MIEIVFPEQPKGCELAFTRTVEVWSERYDRSIPAGLASS
jgi:hypothetical protein